MISAGGSRETRWKRYDCSERLLLEWIAEIARETVSPFLLVVVSVLRSRGRMPVGPTARMAVLLAAGSQELAPP